MALTRCRHSSSWMSPKYRNVRKAAIENAIEESKLGQKYADTVKSFVDDKVEE